MSFIYNWKISGRILSLGGVGVKTWGTKVEIMGDVKAFLHSTPPPNMF